MKEIVLSLFLLCSVIMNWLQFVSLGEQRSLNRAMDKELYFRDDLLKKSSSAIDKAIVMIDDCRTKLQRTEP